MPNLVLATTTNPGDANWVDISGLVSGATVIPNGGTLGGTYQTPVVCLGTATITSPLVVDFDLITIGVITNAGGHSVTVYGDFIAKDLLEFASGAGVSQNNIEVYGDFITPELNFPQRNGTSASVIVHGSFTVGTFTGFGTESSSGASLTVGGSVHLGSEIDCSGATESAATAGEGGNVTIGGDLIGKSGSQVSLAGGGCSSTDENHFSAKGGDLTVAGDVLLNVLSTYGGNRSGVLTAAPVAPGGLPSSGLVLVGGNLVLTILDAYGGSVSTTNFEPQVAGIGGTISVAGDMKTLFRLEISGGTSTFTSNSGGTVEVKGNFFALGDGIYGYGGSSTAESGSYGAIIEVAGNATISFAALNGGASDSKFGSNGGDFVCKGDLVISGYLDSIGGDSNASDSIFAAGNGGLVEAASISGISASVTLRGGFRSGALLSASVVAGGIGGNLYAYGPVSLNLIDLSAGAVSTTAFGKKAGQAGLARVYGQLYCPSFYAEGGSVSGGVTADAGAGGSLNCYAGCTVDLISLRGGSTDSGVRGTGGSTIINGGCQINEYDAPDGGGTGTAPSSPTTLQLSGDCNFFSIDMTNPAVGRSILIRGVNNSPTKLRVNTLVTKQTLNSWAGTATANVSAFTATNLFFTGASGNWYRIASTAGPL